MAIIPEGDETTNWDTFFEARVNEGVADEEQLVGQGSYTEKVVLSSTENQVLEMYIDNRGRRRVELSPVVVDGKRIGDRAGIITKYGDYDLSAKKEPVGHTYLSKAEPWDDVTLSEQLITIGDDDSGWDVVEVTEVKNGQSFKRERKEVSGGSVIRHTTLTGNGHGRVWIVYTPNDQKIIPFECVNRETCQIGLDLSYGITIQQGDASDKPRSLRGTTHYAFSGMSLIG